MKVNVRQAAKLLSVSESEVYRWVESGEIPCVLVKNQPLFGRAELLEWATARRLPVSLELFEHGDEGGAYLRLADVLERGGVHHDVPGRDRAGVLRAVVERLPLDEEDDRELLLQILLARESAGSIRKENADSGISRANQAVRYLGADLEKDRRLAKPDVK